MREYDNENRPYKEKIRRKKKYYKENRYRKIDKKNIASNKIIEYEFIISEQEKVNKIDFSKIK